MNKTLYFLRKMHDPKKKTENSYALQESSR